MSVEVWTLAIALVTAVACALCGSLLLVNRQAMISEGLSHAVLPGIVVAFLLLRDYNSPWLILSAAASGLLMVWLSQFLVSTGIVDGDAGLGIIFSAMFSAGILLVSQNLHNVHFHAGCIIDGNLALAPLDRFRWLGVDWGPRSFVVISALLAVLLLFVVLCFKEIKLALFDPTLAGRFRLMPKLLQTLWLAAVSLTAVTAFDVAGSILIVALMIAPPAAAYLLVDRLGRLLIIAAVIAALSAAGGFSLALILDIAPTGPIASVAGFFFLLVLALAPRRGLLAVFLRRVHQRRETWQILLLDLMSRCRPWGSAGSWERFLESLNWPSHRLRVTLSSLEDQGYIRPGPSGFEVTPHGTEVLALKLQRLLGSQSA